MEKKLLKKLSLRKEVISSLSSDSLKNVKGGTTGGISVYPCATYGCTDWEECETWMCTDQYECNTERCITEQNPNCSFTCTIECETTG